MALKAIGIRVLALALGAIGVSTAYAESDRAPRCSNATLRGQYVYTANGTTSAAVGLPAPLTGAFVSSGMAEYDGNGHVSLTATSSFNGFVQGPSTVTGTYSVNSDCSFTSQVSNGATFRAAIVEDGHELLILQTNNGVTITGAAEQREKRHNADDDGPASLKCTNKTLAGAYGFLAQGFAGAPTVPGAPFAPLAGVGVVNLHADGSFMMMAQRSVNGVLDPQVLPLSGKYLIGEGCTFKMNFDVGFHFDATVLDRNQINFIETDPGTAVIVKAKRI